LRDEVWEKDFLELLPKAEFRLLDEAPQEGPDGFPYLLVKLGGSRKDAIFEPASEVLDWLAARAIGLVINPMKEMPDYVLSYGQIWHHKMFGKFVSDASAE